MANMWSLDIDMRQFADDLRRLPAQMHDAAASVNKKSADEFERTVRRNMPRSDEGPHIADTIEHTLGDAKYAEHIVSIGNDQLPYAVAASRSRVVRRSVAWSTRRRFQPSR